MMKKRMLCLVTIGAILVLALGGCSQGNDNGQTTTQNSATMAGAAADSANNKEEVKPIQIALIYPLSGANAESGTMGTDGAELAVKHINENGGIKSMGGAKLELVKYDGTSDPAQCKNVAERALSSEGVIAGVGSGSSALTLPMIPAFEKAQVPLLTFCNSDSLTNQGYNYIFSITNRGSELGAINGEFIQYLNNEKGYDIKKVAIIYENSANGISMSSGARDKAASLGLEVVFDESYPAGTIDFAPMIASMKNSEADAVMPYAYMQEAKVIFTTMSDMKFHPLVIGTSTFPSFGSGLGDLANGVIATGNWNFYTTIVQDNPEYKAVADEFKETYGYFFAEQSGPTYECIRLIADALEKNPTRDPAVLRDTISANEFTGTMLPGTYKFNEAGENVNGMPTVGQWQNGECVCVYPIDYAAATFIDPSEFK